MEEPEVLETEVTSGIEPAQTAEPGESVPPEPEAEEPTASEEAPKKEKIVSRIDQLTARNKETERDRDYWRELAMRQTPPANEPTKAEITAFPDLLEPKSDQFETYDQFVDARAEWRAEIKMRQMLTQQQATYQKQSKESWVGKGSEKYQDWGEVFTPELNISDTMGQVLLASPVGHDLAYYLGKNPAEARRIYSMPAGMQSYAMGELAARLTPPSQKTKTNAPNPTSPVGGKEVPVKKPDDMTYEEYKQWRASGGGK